MTKAPSPQDPVAAVALLDEPRRRQLYEVVAANQRPTSRDEAAAAVGISRELAAFHLDRLVAVGLLETEYRRLGDRRGPGGGRPAKLYRRSKQELAVSFPPRDYERAAELFADALERLHAGAGTATVSDVARSRGREAGVDARRAAGPRPSRRRLGKALVDVLRGAGYEPEADPNSGSVRLRNCPYHALAASHRELTCGMNLAWAQGMLDGLGDDRLSAEQAPAPGYCCVVFGRLATSAPAGPPR